MWTRIKVRKAHYALSRSILSHTPDKNLSAIQHCPIQLHLALFYYSFLLYILLHLTSPYFATLHLTSPYFTLLHLTSPYFILLHLTSPYFILLHLTSLYLTFLHLTSTYLTLLHLTSSYFTLPHLTSPYITLPHLTSPCFTLPHLTSPYLTLPHLTSPYLTLLHLTSPYLTLLHHTSLLALPYFTLPHLTSSHFTSCITFLLFSLLPDDRLGRLKITRAGLSKRNRMVYTAARRAGARVVVTMGGGYDFLLFFSTVDDLTVPSTNNFIFHALSYTLHLYGIFIKQITVPSCFALLGLTLS